MNSKSRQAKGRYLQNIVKGKIQDLYPVLGPEDIRTSMRSEIAQCLKNSAGKRTIIGIY